MINKYNNTNKKINYPDVYSQLSDSFFTTLFDTSKNTRSLYQNGCTNIYSDDKQYSLKILAPGYSRTDFDISLDQNTVTVTAGNISFEQEKELQRYSEFTLSGFSRSFSLPKNLNRDNVVAQYDNGILSITIPYQKEQRSSRIEVM